MQNELTIVIASMTIALVTQFAKKIRNECGWQCDPKFLAAGIAIIGGIAYAFIKEFTPDEWIAQVTEFGAMSFAGSIAIYEVFKSAIELNEKKENNFSIGFKESLTKLEEQAQKSHIDFERFSLESITRGQKTEQDLKEHVKALVARLNI